jgi:hypothetical protein
MMEILANLMWKTGYQLLMCLGYFHVPNLLLVHSGEKESNSVAGTYLDQNAIWRDDRGTGKL